MNYFGFNLQLTRNQNTVPLNCQLERLLQYACDSHGNSCDLLSNSFMFKNCFKESICTERLHIKCSIYFTCVLTSNKILVQPNGPFVSYCEGLSKCADMLFFLTYRRLPQTAPTQALTPVVVINLCKQYKS